MKKHKINSSIILILFLIDVRSSLQVSESLLSGVDYIPLAFSGSEERNDDSSGAHDLFSSYESTRSSTNNNNATKLNSSSSNGQPKKEEEPLGYIILSMKDTNYDDSLESQTSKQDSDDYSVPTTSSSFTTSTARIHDNDGVDLDYGDPITFSDKNNSIGSQFHTFTFLGGYFQREIWTIPLVSLAIINIFLITFFEIYVLCRAKGRSPLFLGQFLLFGCFLCSSLSIVFIIYPSQLNCYLARVGISVAYSLIFSVLLVKSLFLLSLDSGLALPIAYQACLLLFAILVQIAISVQWVLVSPPNSFENRVFNEKSGPLWQECGTSYNEMLTVTVSYNLFLILFVGILAIQIRKIRENYRESIYIGFSVLVTVPIWFSWTIAGWILQGKSQDACVAFGLISQSLSTFLIMFMPKGRQLAAMGKDGMFAEDQDDQCSGYSPSFFHFKPVKGYKAALIGDTNLYTSLEPTVSTLNPNVYFHRSDFHPGMIY